ncbi:protein disulfide isomerase (macronuclear) [Tetrahymena thermophila SB210]|uniref:Protein disulfide-isomerase n=1 Tax=Tetrahymena thermophila (strain SB210) TaxID=312017 RepID=I7M0B1_TETTS|nr:protein disulfide isomerase [Tetrahymena thermophila SB210]EAR86102.1 protein disulfide isomerase [Tetrahymena thermophila SB210]|eukprot:XP_976697.1 protein disulfide isomerase [Tetrahymena thermophila SB210]
MNVFVIGIIYLIFVLTAIVASLLTIQEKLKFDDENGVLILTDKNFKFALEQHDFIMVEFYAPWCGHCKSLAPQYEKAAQQLKDGNSKAVLSKVDATAEKFVASQFTIQGYPTLKFFIKGKSIEYKGGRTTNDIVAWIERKTGPPSQLVSNPSDLQDIIKDNDVVLAYFGDSEEDKEYKIFESICLTYDHVKFVHSFDSATKDSVKGTFKNVKLFKNYDERENDFGQQQFTAEKLGKFIDDFSHPLVFPWGDTASSKIYSDKNIGVLLFREAFDQSSLLVLQEIAKTRKLKEQIQFAQVDKQHKEYSRISENIGATGLNLPAVFIVDPNEENATYLMEGEELNIKNLDRFINNFKNKRLTKYIKSLPIPENTGTAVQTIVRKNYDQVVRASNKDLLIMYFATWCGHCNQFKPKYEELAKRFVENTNLVFAMYDGVNNAVEDVQVNSYPTLYFFKNGSKASPVKYEGNRDADDLIQFVKKHTTHPWVQPSAQ